MTLLVIEAFTARPIIFHVIDDNDIELETLSCFFDNVLAEAAKLNEKYGKFDTTVLIGNENYTALIKDMLEKYLNIRVSVLKGM